MKQDKICRGFRRDFPDLVGAINSINGIVQAHPGRKKVGEMPTYFLNGDYQLTGYKFDKDGNPFTMDVARAHIQKTVTRITDGRSEVKCLTREQRFSHIVEKMKAIELRRNTFCTYCHPSGDKGTIMDIDIMYTGWVLFWDEEKDAAHAEDFLLYELWEALNDSFTQGGKTISTRTR